MLPLVTLPDTLVISYLEMTSPAEFTPAYLDAVHGLEIVQAVRPDVEFYRFLYSSVGYHLRWRDRLVMPDAELLVALHDPMTRIDVLYAQGVPVGYVELARQAENTEIAYFGLRPQYQGFGYGKHLLSCGIQRAWDDGAARVWVHTCNMDGPHAMQNYLKRGFRVYHVEETPMPDRYKT